jgi:hypothetical protein
MSEEIGFSSTIFSHLPHSGEKSYLLTQYPKIEQSGCTDLLKSVFSIDLCKQKFIKAVNERPLGWRCDFQSNHVIEQSVDVVPYLNLIRKTWRL